MREDKRKEITLNRAEMERVSKNIGTLTSQVHGEKTATDAAQVLDFLPHLKAQEDLLEAVEPTSAGIVRRLVEHLEKFAETGKGTGVACSSP